MLGTSLNRFLNQHLDKQPMLLQRNDPKFYHALSSSSKENKEEFASKFPVAWSSESMSQLIKNGVSDDNGPGVGANRSLRYGTDVNIVRYHTEQKKRIHYKKDGDIKFSEYQDAIQSGWSVRFLRPHEHSKGVSKIIGFMESVFGCSCGANSYWTPSGSQGFAPHYDDVDVFLLQLEGEKQWKLYDPPTADDQLARYSSEDYQPEQLAAPKQAFTLKAGDMLYMPRGTVHQGQTPASSHSLHITFSAFQMHTYADLLQTIVQRHVECLARTDLSLRRGLPLGWMSTMGAINNGKIRHEEFGLEPIDPAFGQQRKEMLKEMRRMVHLVDSTIQSSAEPIDLGADAFSHGMIARRQPAAAAPSAKLPKDGSAVPAEAKIRLMDYNSCRIILKDEEVQIVHCGSNSTVCYGTPVGQLRFERCFAPALAAIFDAAPREGNNPISPTAGDERGGIVIGDLPMPDFEEENDAAENRIVLATALLTTGLFELCAQ